MRAAHSGRLILFSIQTELSQILRQVSLRSLTTLQKRLINEERWAADPGNPHSRAQRSLRFPSFTCLFPPQAAAGYGSKPA